MKGFKLFFNFNILMGSICCKVEPDSANYNMYSDSKIQGSQSDLVVKTKNNLNFSI